MSKVQQARAFFADVDVLETVENTYRPELNGTRRKVTKLGATFYEATLLDGSQAGRECHGSIPTRAAAVIHVDDETATFALDGDGKGIERLKGHTVTLRKVPQDADQMPGQLALSV